MDDRARGQEEQRFEIGMRGKVKYACTVIMSALAHKHVTELADGRIGQHAFDIKLEYRDSGSKERGGATYDCNNNERDWRDLEQRGVAGYKPYTSPHHVGSMHKCTDKRRPFHSIQSPHTHPHPLPSP